MRFAMLLLGVAFLYILALLPYLGLAFGVSLVGSAIGALAFHASFMSAYFSVAWKVYVALALCSLAFHMTFIYQTCCVGLESFRNHLRHHDSDQAFEHLSFALFWPYAWFALDRNLEVLCSSFGEAVVEAIEYWCVGWRRGVSFQTLNLHTGESTITYVKTPEDLARALSGMLQNANEEPSE
jgi:hypothetical protein